MDNATAKDEVKSRLHASSNLFDYRWKDPKKVATTVWRAGALDLIADPQLGSAGVALVEMDLNEAHPAFYGIVRVDDRGVWYSDADGSPQDPVWRLSLIPWRAIDGITLHQSS